MKRQQAAKTRIPQNEPATSPPSGASEHFSKQPLLQLQRALGNQAFGQLIQAKLKISQPGDQFEQEADRVAEQVMRMPASLEGDSLPKPSAAAAPLQRSCAKCEEEEEEKTIQRQAAENADELEVQAKGAAGPSVRDAPAAAGQINNLGNGGEPLPESTRAFFEPRFGYEFNQVRVHTDSEAAESARAVNALAYTVGRDVVFGAGQYAPESGTGRQLLAHELAHVVQQGHSRTVTETDGRQPQQVQLKTDEAAIFRQSPAAVSPALPPNLNFDNLADRVHQAIHGGFFGLGTDEEQVYLALQQLQRNATAITELERVYRQKFQLSLEADIRDDFSGEELEFALQLLNRGTAGSAQAIGATPATTADLEAAARRLRLAVEGLGTDEEAIYAVLLPFNRNMRLIHQLMDVYSNLFSGENLRERIIDEMSGSELDYALYLLGGPAVRANVEITEVTEAEAARLFSEMASLTFWTNTDEQAPIPFHYPPDGCYARAHLMAERLTELGIASEKVFAISTTPGGLRVASNFAADMPAGQQSTPTVQWWYHVAPIIHVRNAAGVVSEQVIDPSLASGPIPISQWTGMMGTAAFQRLPVGGIPALLAANRNRFPAGLNATFTTDRDVFGPTGPFDAPDAARAGESMESVRGRLSSYAQFAGVHELAAALRVEMGKPAINVAAVVAALNSRSHDIRVGLWAALFPNLVTELLSRVNPADKVLIQAALFAP